MSLEHLKGDPSCPDALGGNPDSCVANDRKSLARSIDLRALREYRLARVRAELVKRDCAAVLLYDPVNIRYATDTSNMTVWTTHNAVRYAFVAVNGPVVLFDFHGCAHLSAGIHTVDEVRPATAWLYFGAGQRIQEMAGHWAREIADLVDTHGGGNRRLAVDKCDPSGTEALRRLGVDLQEGQEVMEQARIIKSPDEIKALRVSIDVCEEGMRAMRAAMRPGVTENEVWSELHRVNIARGGEWIETRLLASGPRTNPWFQESSNRPLEAGDLLSFDTDLIGPMNYCADISRSWLVGDGRPSDEQRRIYAMSREQIEFNTALIKPGLSYLEFTEKAWAIPQSFATNRYSCVAHGVGLCDEYPLIFYSQDAELFGCDGIIEENSTLCVESYIGEVGGNEGVKLEQQVLVTANGAVPLSTYEYEDDWL